MKPRLKCCIKNCTLDLFMYTGISSYAVFIDEKNEVKKIITNGGQAGRTICFKCGKDATQVFEKCQVCGRWSADLICFKCHDEWITLNLPSIQKKAGIFNRLSDKYAFEKCRSKKRED